MFVIYDVEPRSIYNVFLYLSVCLELFYCKAIEALFFIYLLLKKCFFIMLNKCIMQQ